MKKNLTTCFASLLVLSICSESIGYCSDSKQSDDHYEYPELSVVPRASERLRSEADKEGSLAWTTYIPIQASALTTLIAGLTTYDSTYAGPGYAGIGVGAGWLALTIFMSASYRPYSSRYNDISSSPKNSTREQLTRERAAEEEIKRADSLGEKLRWFSILTNFGASIYMLAKSENNRNPFEPIHSAQVSNTTQGLQFVSLAMALTPLLFRFHWHEVAEEQADYKKRIYSPVAQAAVLLDPGTRTYVPGLTLSLSF